MSKNTSMSKNQKINILIADDDKALAQTLQESLREYGFNVDICLDGTKVMDLMSEKNYNVLVTDLKMPKSDGIEIGKEVKKAYKNITTVLMTGFGDESKVLSALKGAHFNYYLKKPFKPEELISAINYGLQEEELKKYETEYLHKLEILVEERTRELKYSEELFRSITTHASDAIITTNASCDITFINYAASKLFGYKSSEVLNKNILNLIIPNFNRPNPFHTEKNEGIIETFGVHKNKKEIPIELTYSQFAIKDEFFFSFILRDITEKKILEKQNISSAQKTILTQIAHQMGHEINNSLTVIKGRVDLLKLSKTDITKIEKMIVSVEQEIEKLNFFSSNLLSLGKSFKPSLKEINISELTRQIIRNFKQIGILKYYSLNENYEENLPTIYIDDMLMELAFGNILINAHQAMRGMGTIFVQTRRNKKFVEIIITNTGPVIRKKELKKIFDPLYTTKKDASGLGLYIVKHSINLHKGFVKVSSSEKKGTSFTIGIPEYQ